MRRFITSLVCLLVAVIAYAQFTQPGYYRVHNVATDSYICIKGTKYNKTSNPDAFWSCVKMLNDGSQVSDAGSIIYIPSMGQTSLGAQGVSTYSLTHLYLEIDTAAVREGGKPTYIAKTKYNNFPCIFRDYGNGLTAGYIDQPESRWWIEPINVGSMDTSYFGVQPVNEAVKDADGWYWTSLCCDFPFLVPADGGVEGVYTVQEIVKGDDDAFYAEPVKVYGQGDTVPAALPVLIKCKGMTAADNKLVPVSEVANHTVMPIVSDILMGNYFSNFINHADLLDYSVVTEYVPTQASLASDYNLVLGVNAEGKLGFYPQEIGTYMAANSAWLSTALLAEEIAGQTTVYLGKAPVAEPEPVKGDADGDGDVNIKDVTLLIDYLLTIDTDPSKAPKVNVEALDLNNDGQVTIKDLALMIELLLMNEE